MNAKQMILTVILAAGVAAGRAAHAQPVCDTTFDPRDGENEPVSSGDWHNDLNWTFGSPDATKVACIPPGKKAFATDGGDFEAKALWLQRGEVEGEEKIGIVEVNGASLTVYDDSTLDGEFVLYGLARLVIDGDVTFDGVGGGINVWPALTGLLPGIEGADANAKLTIQPGPGGNNSQLSTTFCIWGGGTIDVELVNDALVIAANTLVDLVVNEPATGNGRWTARHVESATTESSGPGTLVIDAVVGGGGQWRISQSGGEIVFNVSPSNLTGEISLSNGLLKVNTEFETAGDVNLSVGGALEINEDFVSTGKLSMTGNSRIRVQNGAIAQFDEP